MYLSLEKRTLALSIPGLELASLEGTAVFAFNFLVIAGHYSNFQIFKGAPMQYSFLSEGNKAKS